MIVSTASLIYVFQHLIRKDIITAWQIAIEMNTEKQGEKSGS
jgi:hypothetical protein